MELVTPDMVKVGLTLVGAACSVYAGIRADLRRAMDLGKSAHDRIDRHLEHHS